MRMNRVSVLLCVLSWGLVTAENAVAFHNPSTGRWLNRDPEQEIGGLNLYGFVLNNAVSFVDALGNFCVDPCGTAKKLGLDKRSGEKVPDAGGVVCCGGKKYACVWHTGPAKNSKAVEIISQCIYTHELRHFNHTEDCFPCDLLPMRPNRKIDFYAGECEALTVEFSCLQQARKACGNDLVCRKEVLEEMQFVLKRRDEACEKAKKGPL